MKKFKLIFAMLLTFVLVFSVVACGEKPGEGGIGDPPDDEFFNPGDNLGGGGIGETPDEADDSSTSSAKGDVQDKSDLGDLSNNTSSDGAKEQKATSEIVEISESGTYTFAGNYGGILITENKLKLHFIFNGATFTNNDGVAIDGTSKAKNLEVIITLNENTTNTVTNGGDDVNAVHIKGSLSINGTGALNVTSNSKSALKASKAIQIVDATLNLTAANHGVTGASVAAANCTINVASAGKDGINAEGDDMTEFSTGDGYVSLKDVNYTCDVKGDGIQAATVVFINGGNYDIKTTGNFVPKTAMADYNMAADDFKFILSNGNYKRIASDETRRYSSSQLYGLEQGCKGIKVGEIEYTEKDENGNKVTVVVTEGDYLIAITDGTFNIDSTDDAIHANSGNVLIEGGTFEIATYDDAITSDLLTKITGGDITITTSYEGIEGSYVEISGGIIDLTATDDGINAASDDNKVTEHIIISGGDIRVNASGDGIDSNGSILISGGTVLVYGPTSGGDAGLDADKGIIINGGTVFATSTLGMVETPSTNSGQYVVSYAYQSTITAGSVISLLNSNGDKLLSVEILKNCQSIIFSTPDLKLGGTYTLYGGSSQLTSFTVSSIITKIGSSGSSFPGGGGPGGGMGPGGRW